MAISTILVVDDSPTERALISKPLQDAGFKVTTVDSGEEAITKSKELKPDLILMDVVMPGLNGFQATRTITNDEVTKNIPVIIVTTKSEETDRVWGMRQGAKDYITKPVDFDELIGKIKALG